MSSVSHEAPETEAPNAKRRLLQLGTYLADERDHASAWGFIEQVWGLYPDYSLDDAVRRFLKLDGNHRVTSLVCSPLYETTPFSPAAFRCLPG